MKECRSAALCLPRTWPIAMPPELGFLDLFRIRAGLKLESYEGLRVIRKFEGFGRMNVAQQWDEFIRPTG
jgi:hypothetical protein